MNQRVLVDSGFLVALYDRSSTDHGVVKQVTLSLGHRFLVPQVVLTEVFHVLRRNLGSIGANRFLDDFSRSNINLLEVTLPDVQRVYTLRLQYADANLDFVDCAIIATAERLNITMIATLDTRDFTLVRPAHCDFFEIYP